MQDRRFLWGLLTGSLYFCVLAALTLIVNHGLQDVGNHFFTTLMICSGAGMLGGMLS
jgi:putative membrane protein (TIGR04086 family)